MLLEVAIACNGIYLVKSEFKEWESNIDNELLYGVLSGLKTAFNAIFSEELQYFAGKNISVIFAAELVKNDNIIRDEHVEINGYAIFKNEIKGRDDDKVSRIKEKLREILIRFKKKYEGYDFTFGSSFQTFKDEIDSSFKEFYPDKVVHSTVTKSNN